MRRFIPIVLLCAASYLAGYATSPRAAVAAQGQAAEAQNFPMVVEGKGMHWSIDDLKKAHTEGASILLPRTPAYRMQILQRAHHATPQPRGATKIMSQWDDAEMHDNRTDFYVMLGGSGTLVLGGEIQNSTRGASGDRVGQPVTGGTTYKVKAGDLVLIPPRTSHWSQPDPGGMTYVLLTMATRTTPP